MSHVLLNGSAEAFTALVAAEAEAEATTCYNCSYRVAPEWGTLAYRTTRARYCCFCPRCHRLKDHVGECFDVAPDGTLEIFTDADIEANIAWHMERLNSDR